MKRFLSLLLVATLLITCLLTSCNSQKDLQETTPEETTPEETTPVVEDVPFPDEHKKLTEVSITSEGTLSDKTAAENLENYLTKKGVTVGENGFPISLVLNPALGDDSFRVTAVIGEGKEEGMLIEGGNDRGIHYGVYQFLEKYANVRFYTPELEVCEAGDVIISDGVLLDHTPVLKMRQTDWYNWMDDAAKHTWATKVGINLMSGWKPSWNEALGGSLSYAPGLFVHTIGKLAELDSSYPTLQPTPCLTDETIYNTVLANLRKALEQQPDARIVSVSQNDNNNYCKCENCAAIATEEGSQAGVILRFVNRIAAELADEYPDLTIDTLAYRYSLKAPKITKPLPNVCVRLSTISCHFTHPLTKSDCSACSSFRRSIEEWSAICENIYVWDYTTNYSYYLATFPNFHVLRANMRFFAEHNVKGVYEQGNGSGPSGEFGELRAYLIAKLLMNPYMTSEEYDTHMDEFLAAYYGAGWQNIRKYIDTYTRYAKADPDGMGIYNYPFGVLSKQSLEDLDDTFNSWWDAAEAEAGDRLEAVRRSRWQLRYLLLFIHPDGTEARSLVAEVVAKGTKWSERNPDVLWYAYEYDLLSLPPDQWFTPPEN